MESPRRDHLNHMDEHRSMSKSNQKKNYPRFSFTPKELPNICVSFLLWITTPVKVMFVEIRCGETKVISWRLVAPRSCDVDRGLMVLPQPRYQCDKATTAHSTPPHRQLGRRAERWSKSGRRPHLADVRPTPVCQCHVITSNEPEATVRDRRPP